MLSSHHHAIHEPVGDALPAGGGRELFEERGEVIVGEVEDERDAVLIPLDELGDEPAVGVGEFEARIDQGESLGDVGLLPGPGRGGANGDVSATPITPSRRSSPSAAGRR